MDSQQQTSFLQLAAKLSACTPEDAQEAINALPSAEVSKHIFRTFLDDDHSVALYTEFVGALIAMRYHMIKERGYTSAEMAVVLSRADLHAHSVINSDDVEQSQ